MAKNKGEYDEMRVKLHLIELRDLQQSIKIGKKKIVVTKVENAGVSCKSLPKGTILSKLSDEKIEKLAKKVGALKAPAGSKADVFVNGLGISVKSHRGASPAFLNHTHRAGFIKVCERVGVDIKKLDTIIKSYWNKRKQGIITEDVKNSDKNSPFKNHLEYLRPILNYFLFIGTAQKDSAFPADYILDFEDPLNEKKWSFSKDEYIDIVWKNVVFSIRSKGMPNLYPKGDNTNEIKPWVEKIDGKYKGALHARIQF